MTLIVSETIDDIVKTKLEKGLAAHNIMSVGTGHPKPLQISETDDAGLAGGLTGKTLNGWLRISLLWVRANVRNKGLGTQLLEAAEAEAKARGCVGMMVDTYTYQAPEFYKKHGFAEFGVVDNNPPGFACHFLQKTF